MTGWPGATFLVLGFLLLCRIFGMAASARSVLTVTTAAFTAMGDPTLDDDSREVALQRHAVRLFGLFLRLLAGGATAVLLPLGLLWLAARQGWVSWEDSLAVGLSPAFIAPVCALSVAVWWLSRRLSVSAALPDAAGTDDRPASDHSATERLLHRAAFASVPVQLALTRVEQRLFRRRLFDVRPQRPVFITGLPRSGTTLLLELCHHTGEFAAHTYRQMPFVLNPLLWEVCSRHFRRETSTRERAHGDGMLISTDSPEALEEVLWMAYWQPHYESRVIKPWTAEEHAPGFTQQFRRHMALLLAVTPPQQVRDGTAADTAGVPRRYLSKNNLNIARIGWLRRNFPDARIVVPFREPQQHAASLLRQHRNFLQKHKQDAFTCEYMRALGHFDFGANLRPVDFDGWWQQGAALDPLTPEFWLRYWIATYRALLRETSDAGVLLVDFDSLCAAPGAGLRQLADFLGMAHPATLPGQSTSVQQPSMHKPDMQLPAAAAVEEALDLYPLLQQRAASLQ